MAALSSYAPVLRKPRIESKTIIVQSKDQSDRKHKDVGWFGEAVQGTAQLSVVNSVHVKQEFPLKNVYFIYTKKVVESIADCAARNPPLKKFTQLLTTMSNYFSYVLQCRDCTICADKHKQIAQYITTVKDAMQTERAYWKGTLNSFLYKPWIDILLNLKKMPKDNFVSFLLRIVDIILDILSEQYETAAQKINMTDVKYFLF